MPAVVVMAHRHQRPPHRPHRTPPPVTPIGPQTLLSRWLLRTPVYKLVASAAPNPAHRIPENRPGTATHNATPQPCCNHLHGMSLSHGTRTDPTIESWHYLIAHRIGTAASLWSESL